MGHDPVTAGLQAEVTADLVGAGDLHQRRARLIDGFRAGLIGLFAADSNWAHK
jgi:hypothetical protein